MEILREISDRYSPRDYSDKIVEDEEIEALVEAARRAPSARNNQPWRYIFVSKNDDTRKNFEKALPEFNEAWMKNVSHLVVVFAKESDDKSYGGIPYHIYDTGLSAMSIVLEAEHLGLKAHQSAGFDSDKIKEVLNIPKEYDIITVMAVGYQIEDSEDKGNPERKASSEIAYFGKFKD